MFIRTRYEKIATIDHSSKKQSLLIEITSEDEAWITGYEINLSAERYDRIHVIDKTCITRRTRMEMNNKYGTLQRWIP